MTLMTTKTLDVPGAVLTYDIRPNDASTEPILLLFGCPMGASGFPTLASHFESRKINSPNDIVVQSNGSIWFTDSPGALMSTSGPRDEPLQG